MRRHERSPTFRHGDADTVHGFTDGELSLRRGSRTTAGNAALVFCPVASGDGFDGRKSPAHAEHRGLPRASEERLAELGRHLPPPSEEALKIMAADRSSALQASVRGGHRDGAGGGARCRRRRPVVPTSPAALHRGTGESDPPCRERPRAAVAEQRRGGGGGGGDRQPGAGSGLPSDPCRRAWRAC